MNRQEFTTLLDNHQDNLYKMIRSRVATDQDAEDILQEVLLKIYKNHDNFKGNANRSTWFYTICKNAIADYYRNPWWKFSWIFKSAEQQDHSHAGPEQQLLISEKTKEILSLVQTLPAREQEVFRLRFFDHFSLQEIAICTGTSLSTTKTHLYRATHKMRIALKKKGNTT